MSESRIIIDMDIDELMDYVSMSDVVGFVYDCYEYLGASQQQDFIEKLGVEEVIKLLDNGEIVEHLSDEDLIEELELRGYKITKDGSEV